MKEFLMSIPVWGWTIIFLWDVIWKLIALWRAARSKDPIWFVCIGIINTVGILPIVYLLTHKKIDRI